MNSKQSRLLLRYLHFLFQFGVGLLKLLNFALLFVFLESAVVFFKQPFRLVMDEIAENLKAVLLLDRLLLKQLGNRSDPLSNRLQLTVSLLDKTLLG